MLCERLDIHTGFMGGKQPVRLHQADIADRECVHRAGGVKQEQFCGPGADTLHRDEFAARIVQWRGADARQAERAGDERFRDGCEMADLGARLAAGAQGVRIGGEHGFGRNLAQQRLGAGPYGTCRTEGNLLVRDHAGQHGIGWVTCPPDWQAGQVIGARKGGVCKGKGFTGGLQPSLRRACHRPGAGSSPMTTVPTISLLFSLPLAPNFSGPQLRRACPISSAPPSCTIAL